MNLIPTIGNGMHPWFCYSPYIVEMKNGKVVRAEQISISERDYMFLFSMLLYYDPEVVIDSNTTLYRDEEVYKAWLSGDLPML
jgi:hypothetical protein